MEIERGVSERQDKNSKPKYKTPNTLPLSVPGIAAAVQSEETVAEQTVTVAVAAVTVAVTVAVAVGEGRRWLSGGSRGSAMAIIVAVSNCNNETATVTAKVTGKLGTAGEKVSDESTCSYVRPVQTWSEKSCQ